MPTLPSRHPSPRRKRALPRSTRRTAWPLAVALASPLPTWAQATAATSDPQLPAVQVEEQRVPDLRQDGSAASGYRARTAAQIGPLDARPLLDTPYSVHVVPQALMENLQATKPDDVLRINPVTQLTTPQSRFFTGVTVRGFNLGATKRIDGMPNTNMVSVDMEDKERLEVLTGLSGFLWGAGNVGGTLNYVLKRPTYEPLRSVTAGVTEGSNGYLHGDFGGRIDEGGKLAYRLNVVGQDGDTATDHQSIRRGLVSGALDWNLSDRLQVQFDASRSVYRMRGSEAYWSAATGASYPAADLARSNFYGQPFTLTDTAQDHVASRVRWQLGDSVVLRAGVARRTSRSDLVVANNTFIAGGNGNYRVQTSAWEYPDYLNQGAYAYADWRFATGPVRHTLTAGWSADRTTATNYRSSAGGWTTLTSTPVSFGQPVYLADPGLSPTGSKYLAQRTLRRNVLLGDDIRVGDQWSALIGVNQAGILDTGYGATGASTSRYDDSRVTPTAALIYKPLPWLSLYGSTMRSLEQGGVAAATYNGRLVSNAGAVMAPLQSRQVELGLKAEARDVLWTAALFKIDKGLQYYDVSGSGPVTYVQDGRQVHQGLEFTATGKPMRGLTVVGGLTLLDAKVKENQQSPSLEGKTPMNVAERTAKLYLEYELDDVPGLTLTGGAYYTGPQYADAANTQRLPGFATFDLGLRYALRAAGLPVTLRLNVANVADKRYWLNANYLGSPRTVALSGQIKF